MLLRDIKAELGCSESPIRTLDKQKIVTIKSVAQLRDPLAGMEMIRTQPFDLMEGQQRALDMIHQALEANPRETVLLQGLREVGRRKYISKPSNRH